MPISLVVILVSASAFTVLALLVSYEERKSVRLAAGMRIFLDRQSDRLQRVCEGVSAHYGRGWARLVTHYFTHTILATLLRTIERTEVLLKGLIRRNTLTAERVYTERSRELQHNSTSQLSEIARHKEAVQLSDAEKQARRDAHLEGKM